MIDVRLGDGDRELAGLDLFERLGDLNGRAVLLHRLSIQAMRSGDLERAPLDPEIVERHRRPIRADELERERRYRLGKRESDDGRRGFDYEFTVEDQIAQGDARLHFAFEAHQHGFRHVQRHYARGCGKCHQT